MPRKAQLFKHEQNDAGHKNILIRRKCGSRDKRKKKKRTTKTKNPTHKNTI